MTLEQLKYIMAIKKEKSINMVGKKNNISQQKISYAILSLENELGVKIFNRNAKGVQMTRIGNEVAEFAENFLWELAQLQQKFRGEEDLKVLDLKIHMSYWIPNFFVTQFMFNLFKEYNYPIENIIKKSTNELIEEILDNKIDLAFIAVTKSYKNEANNWAEGVYFQKIAQFVPCFLVNQKNHLSKQKYLKWSNISNESIVCEKSMAEFLRQEDFLNKKAKLINFRSTDNINIFKKLVENNLAIGFDLKILNQKSEMEQTLEINHCQEITVSPMDRFYVEVGFIYKRGLLQNKDLKILLDVLNKNY